MRQWSSRKKLESPPPDCAASSGIRIARPGIASLGRDGQLDPLGLELRHEAGFLRRPHVRLVRLDQILLHQLEQRVVEREHAELAAGPNERGDLERLALAD